MEELKEGAQVQEGMEYGDAAFLTTQLQKETEKEEADLKSRCLQDLQRVNLIHTHTRTHTHSQKALHPLSCSPDLRTSVALQVSNQRRTKASTGYFFTPVFSCKSLTFQPTVKTKGLILGYTFVLKMFTFPHFWRNFQVSLLRFL